MTGTIQVIPCYFYKHKVTGKLRSPFSSFLVGESEQYEYTRYGYTWRTVDHNGVCTQGICRKPVETIKEAEEIAAKYAQVRKYKILPTKE